MGKDEKMKKWVLKDEWLFQIWMRGTGEFKVIVLGPGRRDRKFARGLARQIEIRLTRAAKR